MTRWDDASGTIRDLDVTTSDLGQWTLVLMEPDARRAERVAHALRWSVGDDQYPRVRSTDRAVPVDVDWAGVTVWVPDVEAQDPYLLIEILAGCELSTKQPDLGGSDGGRTVALHEPDTFTRASGSFAPSTTARDRREPGIESVGAPATEGMVGPVSSIRDDP